MQVVAPGIRVVRMTLDHGKPARAGDKRVVLEAFKEGTKLSEQRRIIDDGGNPDGGSSPTIVPGSDGLY